jgi:hypothetical protein
MKQTYTQTLKFQKIRTITEIRAIALYLINSGLSFSFMLEARFL